MMKEELSGNLSFKEKYLKEVKEKYSASTYKNTELLLRTAKFYEDTYGKDIYDFTLSEMVNMFKGFRTKTVNALKHRMSVYTSYINRAIFEGLTTNNVIDMILPDEYADMVDREATSHRYVLRSKLFEDISYLTNAQDQVIFALLFDGVMGRNYENLTNLKVADIDEETLVAKLFDGNEIQLSKETYNIIQIAISETSYDTYSESEIVYPLPPNEFVVRVPKRPKGNELEPVKSNSIRTKIDQFKKDLDMEGLTGRSIYLSGVAERFIRKHGNEDRTSVLNEWLIDNNIKTNSNEMMGIVKLIIDKK